MLQAHPHLLLLLHFLHDHIIVLSIAAYWFYSAVIGGMPEPQPTSSMTYTWAYHSLHILAGNLSTAFANRFPALTVPAGAAVQHKEVTTVVTPSI